MRCLHPMWFEIMCRDSKISGLLLVNVQSASTIFMKRTSLQSFMQIKNGTGIELWANC